jgi:hypothetical protein
MFLPMLRLLLAVLFTLSATANQTTVARGDRVTITLPVSSPMARISSSSRMMPMWFVSGGIDRGACGFSGCLSSPGTATMTETIQIASAPLGPLTLTALASAADGSYVTRR